VVPGKLTGIYITIGGTGSIDGQRIGYQLQERRFSRSGRAQDDRYAAFGETQIHVV